MKKLIVIVSILIVYILFDPYGYLASSVGEFYKDRGKLIYDELRHLRNFLDPTYEELPSIKLSLSQKNIKFLTEVRNNALSVQEEVYSRDGGAMLPEHGNRYQDESKTTLAYMGEEYKVKVKYHGTDSPHFLNNKKSYSIQVSKGKLLDNMREFALIIPDQLNISMMLSYYLVKKYMDISVKSELVRVEINGVDYGLYFLEEKLTKELLERNGLAGMDVMQLVKRWVSQYIGPHEHGFSYNLSHVKIKNYSKLDNGQFLKLRKVYDSTSYTELEKILDIDQFARYAALMMLHAGQKSSGDDFKLLYNTSTGRFLPSYYRSEGVIGRLRNFQSKVTFSYEKISKNIKIFDILLRNDEFRHLRNVYLFQILKEEKNMVNYMNLLGKKFISAIKNDTSNNRSQIQYIEKINSVINNLNDNIGIIRKYLSYGRVFSVLTQHDNKNFQLEISPDVNSFIVIKNFSLGKQMSEQDFVKVIDLQNDSSERISAEQLETYFKGKRFITSLDDEFELTAKTYKYKIVFEKEVKVEEFDVKFFNTVTETEIKHKDNFIRYMVKPSNFSFDYLTDDVDQIINFYSGLEKDNKTIIFNSGLYEIKENLIFPYGYTVSIEKGTTIQIAGRRSLVVYGEFNVNGTKEDPVVITNLELKEPFSSVIVIGSEEMTSPNISYLDLSGGSESLINGIYASGALSLHDHKKVTIKNSKIHHNKADDGLNIKNSGVMLRDNHFYANFADQVDLDNCFGQVVNNRFVNDSEEKNSKKITLNKTSNGDGLDFSESEVLVKDNIFIGFLDKAISAGESSNLLISNNEFVQNRSAITAKDQSNIFLNSNDYDTNEIDIEMFRKKSIYSSPSVFNLNDKPKVNKIVKSDNSHYYKLQENFVLSNEISWPEILKEMHQLEWVEY